MASFQPKIGLKRPRKRENKIKKIFPTSSYSTRNRKFQKKSKKIQKNKKPYSDFFSNKNKLEKADKGRK